MAQDNVISMSEALGSGYNRFYHSRNFYRVVKGSRGSKKSKNTALDYVKKILRYDWANLLVVRRFSNTNKQSTYTDFKWAAKRLKCFDDFHWNESTPEITVKDTGQKILFRGLDDELKLTSITVDTGILSWAWVEEAYQIETKSKFETLAESIRGTYDDPNFYKQITLTFNPWNEHHWLKGAFFDPETRFDDVFAITTTFRHNEWLDEQDRRRYMDLYRTNPRRARVVCDGEWGVAEGLVFEDNVTIMEFNIAKRLIHNTTAFGMDFGFKNDPSTFVASAIDSEKKRIYIFDEYYKQGLLTDDIYKNVVDLGYKNERITADNAEPRLIEELKRKGLSGIQPSRKGKDSIKHGINFLQGYQIVIHPRCQKTIEEFSSYSYKQDKEGNWLNEPEDKNNHIIDALRYSIERYSLPKPKKKKVSKKIKTMKRMVG